MDILFIEQYIRTEQVVIMIVWHQRHFLDKRSVKDKHFFRFKQSSLLVPAVLASGAVTTCTCFNDLDLLRSGIKPRSLTCKANASALRIPT